MYSVSWEFQVQVDTINSSGAEASVKDIDEIRDKVAQAVAPDLVPAIVRFMVNTVGGAIPYIGGAFAATTSAWSEHKRHSLNELLAAWLKLQEDETREIGRTLAEVLLRIDLEDPKVDERVRSPEYLSLVRKSFRDWSAAENEEKRKYVRNLLCNAAAPEQLCGDDVIRLFVKWIDDYSEAHFQVVKATYNRDGITRRLIWLEIHGEEVREDAPEADFFKLLMRDLSMGGIIRQFRETDEYGNYLRQRKRRKQGPTLKSAFDDTEQYELTGLGRWFVHYTMNEVVPRIADTVQADSFDS